MTRPPLPRKPSPAALLTPTKVEAPAFVIPEGKFQAPRIILNAIEGWGKTSTVAFAKNAVIIMSPLEDGYLTLVGVGRVPKIPYVQVNSWEELIALTSKRENFPENTELIAFDAFDGFEILCYDFICRTEFKGIWGEKGFKGWQRGADVAVSAWRILLQNVQRLSKHGIAIVYLSHAMPVKFRDPMAPDYDKWLAICNQRTWNATTATIDAILFGNFLSDIKEDESKRLKGIGGILRMLYCENRDAYYAKNRFGMPAVLAIPDDPSQVWDTIYNSIKGDVNNG